jgi:hypothetical protein
MTQYAVSAQVHKTLALAWDSWARLEGFKRTGSGKCAYRKSASDQSPLVLAFEVQCNSFGNASIGNRFTLNAGAGPDARYLFGPRSRIFALATPELSALAATMERTIHSRHPAVQWPNTTWEPGRDNWCCYYDAEDVASWGSLLLAHLPILLAKLVAVSGYSPEQFALPAAQA